MKNPVIATRELVRGAARFHDLIYVISKGKTLVKDEIAHTSVVSVDGDDWADGVDTAWNSTAIAVARRPSEKMVLVGEDGEVATYVGGKSTKESLKPAPVMIRNAREIGGLVFACGMKRQVYKRVGEAKWVAMNAPAATATEKAGFEAIDGYSETDIYAAGWGGEVWRFDGKGWASCDSPTRVVLSAVCCAPDGSVYVAGQQGVLLKGRGSAFTAVAWAEEVTSDLWDLCWFRDKLYVATTTALYTLEGNRLVEVDFGAVGTPTCQSLTTAEDVLWSIGRDDVASFDGTAWRRYE
ncbi:hypothetical protein LZ198_27330 [Myxococcus sp. K15C18031901]|uniref:hypothetical protein n=1 Tax=Myxococcus dinghuensis TaxID=2906761 RepID=UPI0020A830D1|nr:hypothetical protein [Myxococcus dinghuensis]MCP3102592.1 hypothetical protein [Myxococcus dinghuensis]